MMATLVHVVVAPRLSTNAAAPGGAADPVKSRRGRESRSPSWEHHARAGGRTLLLTAPDCVLFVVDIQARLAPALADAEVVLARAAVLLAAAGRLGVPVLVSEQYPQGLGHTDARLALPEGAAVFPKAAFSAAADPAIAAHLRGLGRRQAVLCGMETHVCVLQTALGLKGSGWEVAVAADAVGSRHPERKRLGLERLRANGVEVVDSEMVVFEWLGSAGTAEFRELSRLIR
jgi:nicotinamidase-related amidase